MSDELRRLRTIAFGLGWEACEKFGEPILQAIRARVWDDGFSEAVRQHMAQERDPSHIFRRDNPYGQPEQGSDL